MNDATTCQIARRAGAQSPPTVAQALAEVETWSDVPDGRRRVLASSLHALTRLEGRPTESIRLDPVAAIARMEAASPVKLGIAASTFANYRAALRHVLRRLGLLAPQRPRAPAAQDPAWTDLLSQVPAGPGFSRLRAFVGYCAREAIAPAAVTSATLDAYAEARAAARGGAKSRDHVRRVALQWNLAGRQVTGWPQTRLGLTGRAIQLSLPFEAYPMSLQRETAAYLDAIGTSSSAGLFSGSARRPVKPSTATSRMYGLRRLLWGGVQAGVPIDTITALRDVTSPDFIKASLNWHYARKGHEVTKDLGQLAATVASVAHHLELPASEWAAIKPLLARATPVPQTEMVPDKVRLLDALSEPATRARLLHLPATLMREASRLRVGWVDRKGVQHVARPVEAGWLAGIAVAIELLLHAPMRLNNLQTLRIGEELRLASVGRGRWRGTIYIAGGSVKNGRAIEFPLEAESIELVREYLDAYRPAVPNADTPWLFPGQASADQPRNKASFGTAISETIHEHVGVRVHPHAFRAFAGALILEANPHAIDDVRAVLGHASFATALTYYRRSSQRAAAGRLSETLTRQRRSTRLLAQARSPLPKGGAAWHRPR